MAKVTIKGIPNVTKRVKDTFESIRKDPELLVEITKVMQDEMIGQARSGKDTQTGTRYPALSQAWVVTRDYLSRFNSKDTKYFAGGRRSNLTFTGALLGKGTSRRIDQKTGSAFVEASKGNHPGYKTGSGKRTKGPSYDDLIKYQAAAGRRFLVVSDRLVSRINVLTKRFVRKLILSKRF